MKFTSILILILLVGCGDDITKKQIPPPTPDMGEDLDEQDSGGQGTEDQGFEDQGPDANIGENRAPQFSNLPASVRTPRGSAGSFELAASDPDQDSLSFGLVDTDCPFEVQVIATSGAVSWLCPFQTLSCEATVSVKDDEGLLDQGVLSVECERPAPVITSLPPFPVNEGELVAYSVECSDPEGAAVTISIGSSDTCGGTLVGNQYRWTPSASQADKVCILTVECTNGEKIAAQTADVQVNGVNKAPTVANVRITPSSPSAQGETLTCEYAFSDPDGDQDQSTIEWLVDGMLLGSGATFSDYEAGESVRCRVTPFDGDLSGPPQTSSPIVFEWELLIRASNEYTCVRTRLGGVRCWGHNRSGVIGSSTTGFRSVHPPTTPPGLSSNVSQLATGYDFACAVQGADLKCWGAGDIAGQNTHTPTTILSGGVTSIAGGLGQMCVVQNGALKCWGSNFTGQVGIGMTSSRVATPTTVPGLTSGVTQVATGDLHTCAIQNGGLKCWGSNSSGQVGVATNFDTSTSITSPVQVQGLTSNVTEVWALTGYTCARHNGVLKCFGSNSIGQLGRGTSSNGEWSAAQATVIPSTFTELAVGLFNTCFINASTLSCLGGNSGILLGFQGTSSLNPVAVLQPTSTHISLGTQHACAERNGIISCWGSNNYGQLGDGIGTGVSTPQGLTQVNY